MKLLEREGVIRKKKKKSLPELCVNSTFSPLSALLQTGQMCWRSLDMSCLNPRGALKVICIYKRAKCHNPVVNSYFGPEELLLFHV